MERVAILESKTGTHISIAYDPGRLETLACEGKVDAYIVSTEDGFSPLGANKRFLSTDLRVPQEEMKRLADWNRFENPRVTLAALPSRRDGSRLRGAILAPSETSECYKALATPLYGRPYRDFYYNVTYEAIAFASRNWGAHRIAISHLSGSGKFHEDIATCNAEALAHFCDANASAIDSFIFLGCCISLEHLGGIPQLNAEGKTGEHRPIATQIENRNGCALVHLQWDHNA